jgi:uncharacterized protein (TIGR00251 family)
VSLSVKVVTGASKTAIIGIEQEALKVKLAALPVDGKANQVLIELIAKWLSIPKASIRIQSGLTSRRKVISIENFEEKRLRRILASHQ